MQTSKIKVGEVYAIKRGTELVRFHVNEVVTRRSGNDRATNEIFGVVLEDRKEGETAHQMKVDPDRLIGPYAEQAALVERKAQEDAERKAKEDERRAQAMADRRAMYRFVRAEVPKKADEYHQLFRVAYGSSLEFSTEGKQAILKRVREMQGVGAAGGAETPALRVVTE
jgi:hypothetical protein